MSEKSLSLPASRNACLTYDNMQTNSGEFFARLDMPSDFFVKGFIGGGRTNSGHMNDEDFGIPPGLVGPFFVPYSNTLASNVTGNIGYGVVDVGYDFWRGLTYKAGAFIGYTQFHQVMNASGCAQVANPFSDCSSANPFSPPSQTSVLSITENDTWMALRVGMSAEAMVTDRIMVGADVAWLPHVSFEGLDTHWQRVPVLLFLKPPAEVKVCSSKVYCLITLRRDLVSVLVADTGLRGPRMELIRPREQHSLIISEALSNKPVPSFRRPTNSACRPNPEFGHRSLTRSKGIKPE